MKKLDIQYLSSEDLFVHLEKVMKIPASVKRLTLTIGVDTIPELYVESSAECIVSETPQ